MIDPIDFYKTFIECDIDFFTGVPDSLLKDICSVISSKTDPAKNIIAANEGNAIGIATGYHLATGKVPLVYMQNSGIGNAVNPLLSLTDKEVYSIPMILLIGWRGEPGIKDEPQHVKQGKVTLQLLEAMGIEYEILPDNLDQAKEVLTNLTEKSINESKTCAIVVRKNTFEKYNGTQKNSDDKLLSREESLELILEQLNEDDIIVSTTGKLSRELYELREKRNEGHARDFLTVGSMGHSSQIALGIALQKPNRRVVCLDGDGAFLMHMGGSAIVGAMKPKNFVHIIFNNGAHESVGGQPTVADEIVFEDIANGLIYFSAYKVNTITEINDLKDKILNKDGPILVEVKINCGSRKDLGRPISTPLENKSQFTKFIKSN